MADPLQQPPTTTTPTSSAVQPATTVQPATDAAGPPAQPADAVAEAIVALSKAESDADDAIKARDAARVNVAAALRAGGHEFENSKVVAGRAWYVDGNAVKSHGLAP